MILRFQTVDFPIKIPYNFQAVSNTLSWTSFFRLWIFPDAKMLDFGTPLAPSGVQNDTKNRPSGAFWLAPEVISGSLGVTMGSVGVKSTTSAIWPFPKLPFDHFKGILLIAFPSFSLLSVWRVSFRSQYFAWILKDFRSSFAKFSMYFLRQMHKLHAGNQKMV